MAPKLPGKFDDISKTASSVLGDDFQCSGYQFKTKQKTNVGGGSAELAVDILQKGEVQTPAKLTFKFPKPFSHVVLVSSRADIPQVIKVLEGYS